jgi:hypothetical protein
VYIDGIQWSAAEGVIDFGSGGGSTVTQRVVFGYPGAKEYIDSKGNRWEPALEVRCPLRARVDGAKQSWWTTPRANKIAGTRDPVLYQHGMHARYFAVHFTVKPTTTYYVRLKLCETRDLPPEQRAMNIRINEDLVASNLDIAATAGGKRRAVDLVFNGIRPSSGVISVSFSGSAVRNGNGKTVRNEAIAQAIEVGPGNGGEGVAPVELSPDRVLD